MREILALGVAGGLGALSRYGLSNLAYRVMGDGFPYGTALVNVIGCFLLGFVMHLSVATDMLPPQYRAAITVGFLGALTTFSTFSYETVKLIEDAAWGMAVCNIAVNVLLGLGATLAGLLTGKIIFGGA